MRAAHVWRGVWRGGGPVAGASVRAARPSRHRWAVWGSRRLHWRPTRVGPATVVRRFCWRTTKAEVDGDPGRW